MDWMTQSLKRAEAPASCRAADDVRRRARLAADAARFLFCCSLAFFWMAIASGQSVSGEYQLKAAFVYHFTQMVEWPADAMGPGTSPVVLCTMEDGEYQSALNSAAGGKQIGAHPIQVRSLHNSDPRTCNVLVISGKDKKRTQAILEATKDAPILTVGDSEDFASSGGIIAFFVEDNKIRFDVNLYAAQHTNLKISSRLLLLARNVIASNGQKVATP
jgi:hypothetical protein